MCDFFQCSYRSSAYELSQPIIIPACSLRACVSLQGGNWKMMGSDWSLSGATSVWGLCCSPCKRQLVSQHVKCQLTHLSVHTHPPNQSVFTLFPLTHKTQTELNLLTFIWMHHNSTSKKRESSYICTELQYHKNTQTHAENLSHVEALCNGGKQIQQPTIHAAWCKYPCAGSNQGSADGGKANPFPCSQERSPRKEETCLLQLRLMI